MNEFTVGQKLVGTGTNDRGLDFEVVQVTPVVKVKCLSVNDFWRSRRLEPFPAPSPHVQQMWQVGQEYDLRFVHAGSEYGIYAAVDFRMPWHSFLTNGQVMYYR
jgi:hypothetical protein